MSLLNTSHQFRFSPKPYFRYISPTEATIFISSFYFVRLLLFYEDTFL